MVTKLAWLPVAFSVCFYFFIVGWWSSGAAWPVWVEPFAWSFAIPCVALGDVVLMWKLKRELED